MGHERREEITHEELMNALADYVTTHEAAELMGMWVKSVRNLINTTPPRLDAIKVGRDWLVSRDSITRYLATKSAKGRPTRTRPQE